MPALLRIALVLTLCLLPAWARADSWAPPSREVYTSADGATRLTIDPRPIAGALEYFSDKVDNKSPAGQPEGATATTPMGQLEQRAADGRWQTIWRQPLVNDVGPTNAVVANGGARVATFDNWHHAGLGDDVVVIYDAAGKTVRKLSLAQLLPPHYPAFLPRSVSSLWWRKDASVSADGQWLVVQVMAPGMNPMDEAAGTVPVRVRLADGAVQAYEGEGWSNAHARLAELVVQRDGAWQAYRTQRAHPLLPPDGDDTKAWREYMIELRERLGDDEHPFAGMVLQARHADFMDDEGGARDLVGMLGNADMGVDRAVFVSPHGERLARVLASALKEKAAASCRGSQLALLATAEDFAKVEQAAAPCGLQLQRLDPTTPPPGQVLPALAPDYFIGTSPQG